MANVKNFGIAGVGSDVQLGKSGGRVVYAATGGGAGATPVMSFNESDGVTLLPVKAAAAVDASELVTKAQLDGVSSGIVVLGACQTVTESAIIGVDSGDGACAWVGLDSGWSATPTEAQVGEFTNAPRSIGGITVAVNDRVLVREEGITDIDTSPAVSTNSHTNGVYVVTALTGTSSCTMRRADDNGGSLATASDGDEAYSRNDGNFQYGNYTFISGGNAQGNAYLLSNYLNISDPDADPEPNLNRPWSGGDESGAAVFLLFSQAPSYTADQGVQLAGGNFSMDLDSLADATIAGSSTVAFGDGVLGGTDNKTTMTDLMNTLDIVNGVTTNGLLTRTADDTYAARTMTASAVAGEEGITITDGDGVSGDPTFGLDIVGLTAESTEIVDTDEFVFNDGTNNLKVDALLVKTYMQSGLSQNQIIQGDSSVVVTDTGSDGTITFTADGASQGTITSTGATFNSMAVSDLTDGRLVLAGTSGELQDDANLTFTTATDSLTIGSLAITGNDTTLQSIVGSGLNTDISIVPNGTGDVVIGSSGDGVVASDTGQSLSVTADVNLTMGGAVSGAGDVKIQYNSLDAAQFVANASADTHLVFTSDTAANNPTISSSGSTDIKFTLTSGNLVVVNDSAQYISDIDSENNPAALVTKGWVDQQINANVPTDISKVAFATVALDADGTTNVDVAMPAGAIVLRVKVNVTTLDSAATLSIGKTGAVDAYMTTDENDTQAVGMYVAEAFVQEGSSEQIIATVASSAGDGGASCQVIVEYRT